MVTKQELQSVFPAAVPFLVYAHENYKKGGHLGVFPTDETLRNRLIEIDPKLEDDSAYGNFLTYLYDIDLIRGAKTSSSLIRVIRCGITAKGINFLHEIPKEEQKIATVAIHGDNKGNINAASTGGNVSGNIQQIVEKSRNHELIEELLSKYSDEITLKEGKEIEALKSKEDWQGLKLLFQRLKEAGKNSAEFLSHITTVMAKLAI